nr:MAG TPA: hypothetical protein [Bacteriophage sp.]
MYLSKTAQKMYISFYFLAHFVLLIIYLKKI